jgi:uncharacterized protein YigA (DUF484 family)
MIGGLTETQMAELGSLNNQVLEARSAFEEAAKKVSSLQLKIANLTSPLSFEGRVARRNAILMALNARDEERAEALKNKFCAEDDAGMNTRFLNELRAMLSARPDEAS